MGGKEAFRGGKKKKGREETGSKAIVDASFSLRTCPEIPFRFEMFEKKKGKGRGERKKKREEGKEDIWKKRKGARHFKRTVFLPVPTLTEASQKGRRQRRKGRTGKQERPGKKEKKKDGRNPALPFSLKSSSFSIGKGREGKGKGKKGGGGGNHIARKKEGKVVILINQLSVTKNAEASVLKGKKGERKGGRTRFYNI